MSKRTNQYKFDGHNYLPKGCFKKKSKQLVGCTGKRQWTVNDRKRVMFKMNPSV